MKQTIKMIALLFVATLVAFSCKKDDNDDPDEPGVLVEDGIYLIGPATPFTGPELDGMLANTPNENGGVFRASLYEIYAPLTAGTLQIQEVAGSKIVKNGGTLKYTYKGSGANEQPTVPVSYYTPTADANITITQPGMYHIAYDNELKVITVARIEWGIRGGLNGWGFTKFDEVSADFKTFSIKNLEINEGDFKFAYSGGWKLGLDDTTGTANVRVNTNFGGTFTASGATLTNTLVPGGPNYAFNKDYKGKYTVTMTWTKGAGYAAQMVKTGESEQPEYPDNIYMIGSFVDWSWDNAVIEMVPAHGNPQAFWTITYFEAGTEFKFAPVKAWSGDFGVSGSATDGVYDRGGSNIVIDESGVYMIFVDLEEAKIYVGEPFVYLMGSTSFEGAWDSGVAENLFTEVDTTLTHTTFGAGELRLYATCPLAVGIDWWQMEFMVLDGKIVYRGKGNDQDRVNVSAGAVITLDYADNTGKIE